MNTSIRATLFCIIVLTTGASATLAQKQPASEIPRNQAIKKINGFRDDQGDKYDVPNQPPTDSTVYTVEYAAKVQETTPDPQRKQADTPKRRLLTHAAKDRFFAYQTLRYLTGKTDLSYYNTYFTASSGDGSFNLGHTITHKTEALEQVIAVTNLGVKTNLLNGLGNLYSARVWNREIGFFVNQTWLNRGKIWYDTPNNTVNHVDSMDRERAYLRQMIKTEIDREAGAFELIQQQALASLSAGIDRADFEARQARDAKKFYKELAKKEVEQFLEKEVAVGRKYVNHARKSWFTLRGSVAGTSHLVLTGTNVEIRNRNFVPFKAGFDYSLYAENFDDGKTKSRILFTASTALFNTNQIRILERYGKDAASALGGKKVTKDGDTFWQGDYNTIVQGSIQARGVFTLPQLAPKWSKDVSLDLFGDFGIGRYSAHDVGAGLLFTLAGQEEKKPVNVEVLFKFVDVSRKLLPGKEALDRLQIGLSLAMPIDGMLNKL